ncbi:hypothetical protein BU14_1684s0003 [Porphyra umbilicalis]|uniref:Uncharacterized protein n=1 Tax=Porphyra umbilicalis TaxID=2786 RepID=A0A1X6NLQ3_PORUM|nr:hypothetical protein BU14_1684s0003 [Porphyra umbilicalis]|eukprot:OSX69263.1 hypothetical protein BU14_1684s0003 [Porphyra umbilicalis]
MWRSRLFAARPPSRRTGVCRYRLIHTRVSGSTAAPPRSPSKPVPALSLKARPHALPQSPSTPH